MRRMVLDGASHLSVCRAMQTKLAPRTALLRPVCFQACFDVCMLDRGACLIRMLALAMPVTQLNRFQARSLGNVCPFSEVQLQQLVSNSYIAPSPFHCLKEGARSCRHRHPQFYHIVSAAVLLALLPGPCTSCPLHRLFNPLRPLSMQCRLAA